jgi:hypothetical protein
MRRPATLLTLALSSWLLAACASSTPAAHPAGATAARGRSAAGALSRQRALAFAHAVNLTSADLPGFKAASEAEHRTSRELRAERDALRCTGSEGPHDGLIQVSSGKFELKRDVLDFGVSSEVGVAKSAPAAASELAAIRSTRVRGCFSRYLDELLQGRRFGKAVVHPVSIQSGVPPAPGTTGGFGWRVTATLTENGIKVSFYMDILGFVYGPARVTLFSSGALLPFPAAVEQQLYSRLLDRAKAFRL